MLPGSLVHKLKLIKRSETQSLISSLALLSRTATSTPTTAQTGKQPLSKLSRSSSRRNPSARLSWLLTKETTLLLARLAKLSPKPAEVLAMEARSD